MFTLEPDAQAPTRFRVLKNGAPVGLIHQTAPDEWLVNYAVAKGGALSPVPRGPFKTRDLAFEAFKEAPEADV